MPEQTEIDPVSQVREMLRQKAGLTANEVKHRLNLTTKLEAEEYLKAAREKERELVSNLAKEDAAGQQAVAPQPEMKFYLKDKETGIVHKLDLETESGSNAVFVLRDTAVKIVKG